MHANNLLLQFVIIKTDNFARQLVILAVVQVKNIYLLLHYFLCMTAWQIFSYWHQLFISMNSKTKEKQSISKIVSTKSSSHNWKKWCKNNRFFLFMFCVEIKFEVRIWGHDMNKDFINNSSAYYQRIVAINQNINIFRIFHFCLLISYSRALFWCRNGIYTHFIPKVRSSIKFTTIHI